MQLAELTIIIIFISLYKYLELISGLCVPLTLPIPRLDVLCGVLVCPQQPEAIQLWQPLYEAWRKDSDWPGSLQEPGGWWFLQPGAWLVVHGHVPAHLFTCCVLLFLVGSNGKGNFVLYPGPHPNCIRSPASGQLGAVSTHRCRVSCRCCGYHINPDKNRLSSCTISCFTLWSEINPAR